VTENGDVFGGSLEDRGVWLSAGEIKRKLKQEDKEKVDST
jgi:hypothetical protein